MENSNIVCTDSQIEKTEKHYIDCIGFFPTACDTLTEKRITKVCSDKGSEGVVQQGDYCTRLELSFIMRAQNPYNDGDLTYYTTKDILKDKTAEEINKTVNHITNTTLCLLLLRTDYSLYYVSNAETIDNAFIAGSRMGLNNLAYTPYHFLVKRLTPIEKQTLDFFKGRAELMEKTGSVGTDTLLKEIELQDIYKYGGKKPSPSPALSKEIIKLVRCLNHYWAYILKKPNLLHEAIMCSGLTLPPELLKDMRDAIDVGRNDKFDDAHHLAQHLGKYTEINEVDLNYYADVDCYDVCVDAMLMIRTNDMYKTFDFEKTNATHVRYAYVVNALKSFVNNDDVDYTTLDPLLLNINILRKHVAEELSPDEKGSLDALVSLYENKVKRVGLGKILKLIKPLTATYQLSEAKIELGLVATAWVYKDVVKRNVSRIYNYVKERVGVCDKNSLFNIIYKVCVDDKFDNGVFDHYFRRYYRNQPEIEVFKLYLGVLQDLEHNVRCDGYTIDRFKSSALLEHMDHFLKDSKEAGLKQQFYVYLRDTLNNDVEAEHSLIALVRDYLSK